MINLPKTIERRIEIPVKVVAKLKNRLSNENYATIKTIVDNDEKNNSLIHKIHQVGLIFVTLTGEDTKKDLDLFVNLKDISVLTNELDKALLNTKLEMYEIYFKDKIGKRVQITDKATIHIPLQKGKTADDVEGVYYILSTGEISERLDCCVVGNMIEFDVTHFGYYMIAYKEDTSSTISALKRQVKLRIGDENKQPSAINNDNNIVEIDKKKSKKTVITTDVKNKSWVGQSSDKDEISKNSSATEARNPATAATLLNTDERNENVILGVIALSILVGLGLVKINNKKEQ